MERDWAKFTLFCFSFYGVLAALIATVECFATDRNPKLEFRPLSPDHNAESTLIWYQGFTHTTNYTQLTDSLDEFLADYETLSSTSGRDQNISQCDYNHPPPKGHVCDVDLSLYSPCVKEDHYGYRRLRPCVFLRLSNVEGWIPEYYNNYNELPDTMPRNLKAHIFNVSKTESHKMNTIWVSCEGENPADEEHIGPIDYKPMPGFPGYFYPYENTENYLSPLVAVHFKRPKWGIIISIECKVWAKNILHDRQKRLGSVHFELLID